MCFSDRVADADGKITERSRFQLRYTNELSREFVAA
jgi:hypothetical protein